MKRFLLIAAFVMCCSTVWGRELHVRPGDYNSIQSAIDDANDDDVVIVAAGTYQENIDFLGKAITVRSVNPNDPNVVAATIIGGSNPADPNYGSVVIFRNGEDANSVLSGFTITGGTGSWLAVSWEFKGLRWNRCGGGVVCYNMSAPTISKNVFTGNIAGQGGGIYIYGDPVNPNDPSNPSVHICPVITDNTFINNSAIIAHGFAPPDNNYPTNDNGDGGAIVGFQGCDATITGNLITNNHGDFYGGGIHLRQWSDGLIENNQIIGNDSKLGAGVHITYTSAPEIVDNLIEYNEAGTFGGGGIYVFYLSNPTIERNNIRHNTSSRGAGIYVACDSKPVISTNLIVDNFEGAGILCIGASPDITHNAIANNTAGIYSGGIHCEHGASPLIEHNIVSSNGDGYGIYVRDGSTPSEPTIRFNDIWNHPKGNYDTEIGDQTGLNGNISASPVFVDSQSGDYHLAVGSPCINAGDPNYPLLSGEADFEGDSRVLGQYIDIGVDEAWPVWNTTNGSQYAGIQQAIDDANDGDTIIASLGRYYETINFGTHQIILSSANPDDWDVVEQTIIDANQTGTAVIISGGQDANTILRGFTITGGDATNGHAGGIWCYAAPTITRNIITENYASYKGGGIYFWSSSAAALVKDNRIINNTASYAGGVFCDSGSRPRLEGNFIGYNTAAYTAGGICCARNTGTPYLLGNTIVSNRAVWGGGMYLDRTSVNAMNNVFAGNMATSFGGAIVIGYYDPCECCDPNLVNNTLAHNKAPQGGGIYCGPKTTPYIANNIISFGPQGEGIYGFDDPCWPGWEAEPNVLHNDVFDNIGGNYGGSLTDQTGINGNISIDPNFVRIGYWDDANTPSDPNDDFFVPGKYHILPGSACNDVGDNNSLPASLDTDIDGEERIFKGTVDIGADEVITNPIDWNDDGIVDYLELEVLTSEWLQDGNDLQSDLYDDDFIDFADFSILASEWFWMGGWYE